MAEDELELLKRRRLIELQRKMLMQQQQKEQQEKASKDDEKPSPRQVLSGYFRDRAWEVYEAAWEQFPKVMPHIEKLLVEAANEGRIKQLIDGESLIHFLRKIGLPIRLKTTIRFKEHGELKTLQQKFRENR